MAVLNLLRVRHPHNVFVHGRCIGRYIMSPNHDILIQTRKPSTSHDVQHPPLDAVAARPAVISELLEDPRSILGEKRTCSYAVHLFA